jgi:hypothetical protein
MDWNIDRMTRVWRAAMLLLAMFASALPCAA